MITSDEVQRTIAIMDGNENASVNYRDAVKYLMPAIIETANDTPVGFPDRSVALGGAVYRLFREERRLMFQKTGCPPVSPIPVASISQWTIKEAHDYVKSRNGTALGRPFGSQIDFVCLLWCLGNCLVDPVQSARLVVLYGAGQNGKSTLLLNLSKVLGQAACRALPDQALVSRYPGESIKAGLVGCLAGARLGTCGDMHSLEDMDSHLVKIITGGDTVSLSGTEVPLRVTLMVATNNAGDPAKVQGFGEDSMARRILMLACDTRFPPHQWAAVQCMPAMDAESCADLVSAALVIRSHYGVMPRPSLKSVLLTLLGERWELAAQYVVVGAEHPDPTDCFTATLTLATLMETNVGWPSGPVQRKVTRVNLYGSIQRTQTNQPTMDPSIPLPVDQAPDVPSEDNDAPPYLVANSANIPNITAHPGPLSKLTLPQAQVGNKCTTWANVKFTSGGQEYDFIQTKALVCSTTGPEKTFYRMAIPTPLYNIVCQAATLGSDMYMNNPNVHDEDWTQVIVDHKKWKVSGLQHAVRVVHDNSTTTGSMQSILARLASADPKQHLE
eukprot:gene22240-26822_t